MIIELKILVDTSKLEELRAFDAIEKALAVEMARLGANGWHAPDRDGAAPVPRPDPEREDRRAPPARASSGGNLPKTGRQFYGWVKDREKDGATGLVDHVTKWAKKQAINGPMVSGARAEAFLMRVFALTQRQGETGG